jgi:hypothetical protein
LSIAECTKSLVDHRVRSLEGGANVVPPPCEPFVHAAYDGFDSRRLHHIFPLKAAT